MNSTNNKHFSWIPFYEELAQKILTYKNRRSELTAIVYGLEDKYVNYLKWKNSNREDNSDTPEIDPFSVFGIFNRGIKDDARIEILRYFKEKFEIAAPVPADFNGIPILNNQKSFFISANSSDFFQNIENLWELFEATLVHNNEKLATCLNAALSRKGWGIAMLTMGLYWIAPNDYLALDSQNKNLLAKTGIVLPQTIGFDAYQKIQDELKAKMNSSESSFKSFPEFSFAAFCESNKNEKTTLNEHSQDEKLNKYIEKYIELLKTNKNLIFHGAPGTGKTFFAKKIAEAMECSENEIGFVQFHPSYDYTDFVEGLRPAKTDNGNAVSFERRDGVFKAFCKKALKNWLDSQKTPEELTKESSLNEMINDFLENSMDAQMKYKIKNGSSFKIKFIEDNKIEIDCLDNEKVKILTIKKTEIFEILKNNVFIGKVKDIREYFNRKYNRQEDSYVWALIKEISKNESKKSKNVVLKEKIIEKPFVFIIDEINRGELSKIFGELFFAIDPGYRGNDGKVKTQYQNLVDADDLFADGFFVPENVYIIGTMNDIDRSVESMDFAMRRRFVFQEISAEDSAENMNITGTPFEAMKRLNEKIKATSELGKDFQIGAAYFLGAQEEDLQKLWDLKLSSLLREYLRGNDPDGKKLDDFKNAFFGKQNNE